jgi:hypothetical protein
VKAKQDFSIYSSVGHFVQRNDFHFCQVVLMSFSQFKRYKADQGSDRPSKTKLNSRTLKDFPKTQICDTVVQNLINKGSEMTMYYMRFTYYKLMYVSNNTVYPLSKKNNFKQEGHDGLEIARLNIETLHDKVQVIL